MLPPRLTLRRTLTSSALGLFAWLGLPSAALAQTLVRVVHGVPGVGPATVEVTEAGASLDLGSISFGQATAWHDLRPGAFAWSLRSQGRTLAGGRGRLGAGSYDIVALEGPHRVYLGIYPTRGGTPGPGLVRFIHAAPALGTSQLAIDAQSVRRRLAYGQATPYLAEIPGEHAFSAWPPRGNKPLVSLANLTVNPGTAYSVIVLGTQGQPVRALSLVDRRAAAGRPSGRRAPAVSPRPAGVSRATRAGTIVVRPGDSLWSIARGLVGRRGGDRAVQHELVAIWNLNAHVIGTGDPNLIYPGTRLRIAAP